MELLCTRHLLILLTLETGIIMQLNAQPRTGAGSHVRRVDVPASCYRSQSFVALERRGHFKVTQIQIRIRMWKAPLIIVLGDMGGDGLSQITPLFRSA